MPGTAWAPRGAAQPWQPQGIPTTCSQVLTFCCWAPQARDSQVSEGCCRQGAEALGFPLTLASSRVLLGTPRASLCNLRRGSWGGRTQGGRWHSQGCTEGTLLCSPREEGDLQDKTRGPPFSPLTRPAAFLNCLWKSTVEGKPREANWSPGAGRVLSAERGCRL